VNGLLGCLYCHSEPDKNLPGAPPRPDKRGAGHVLPEEGGITVVAPNITSDIETGAGGWSDDALARAIREGIGHDGRALFPMMPYMNYRSLPDEDLASVIVYLRTLPPVRNPLPPFEIPFPVSRLILSAPEPITGPVAAPDVSDSVTRGRFLVTQASCRDCHTPSNNGQFNTDLEMAGGFPLSGVSQARVTALNITPDPTGIPYYDETIFITMMRNGQLGARKIDAVMPWSAYGKLTDDDLKAMFAYLKTLRPIKHAIDNTSPPVMCPLCGGTHGLGDRN
jgi:mono/diheme cytochrome c family protein